MEGTAFCHRKYRIKEWQVATRSWNESSTELVFKFKSDSPTPHWNPEFGLDPSFLSWLRNNDTNANKSFMNISDIDRLPSVPLSSTCTNSTICIGTWMYAHWKQLSSRQSSAFDGSSALISASDRSSVDGFVKGWESIGWKWNTFIARAGEIDTVNMNRGDRPRNGFIGRWLDSQDSAAIESGGGYASEYSPSGKMRAISAMNIPAIDGWDSGVKSQQEAHPQPISNYSLYSWHKVIGPSPEQVGFSHVQKEIKVDDRDESFFLSGGFSRRMANIVVYNGPGNEGRSEELVNLWRLEEDGRYCFDCIGSFTKPWAIDDGAITPI